MIRPKQDVEEMIAETMSRNVKPQVHEPSPYDPEIETNHRSVRLGMVMMECLVMESLIFTLGEFRPLAVQAHRPAFVNGAN